MDPQVVLIGIAVFVLSALLIYMISVFGIKEKSFEEAIAEQKRRMEEEREKARLDKKAEREKKKYKRSKEKPKEKALQVSEPEIKEHKMVNLEIDPEIIEPLESTTTEAKKPIKKVKPAKPILANKDEKPRVSAKTQEVVHHVALPKDEVELKHEHDDIIKEKGQPSTKPQKKPEKTKEEKKMAIIEEQIIVEKQTVLHTSASPAMDDKKGQRTTLPMNANQLLSAVNSASLSDSEVQNLIDTLLNKQGGSSSAWNKKTQKGDAVTILRKQLEEKERTLQEEQKLAMQANANLSKERASYGNLEKQYQEKIAVQDEEIQGLRSRMQQSVEQNMIERANMQSRIKQLERQAGDQSILQKLSEENKLLKENLERTKSETVSQKEYSGLTRQLQIFQDELSKNVVKADASENAKKALEEKLAKQEEELKKMRGGEKESENIMSKRVEEVNKQLRKSEAENATVKANLHAAEKECAAMKTRLQELEKALSGNDSNSKELEQKLKGAEKEKSTIQSTLKATEKKLADIEQQKTKLQKDFQTAEKAVTDMESSLKSTEKKLFDLELERNKLQKDVENFDKEKNAWEQTKKAVEQRADDSTLQVSQLRKELETLKQENETLSQDLKVVRETPTRAGAPNGDIHEETAENKISLTQHEKVILEKDGEIKKLTMEVDNSKTEVTKLREEVEKQKKKNNDLREKNWKAMDALQIAEKSASEKVQSAVKIAKDENTALVSEAEKYDKAVLQKLFPEISVNDSLVHKDWMSSFEKEASLQLSQLAKKCESSSSAESKVKHLEGNVSNLESQVQEYKGLLSTTSADYNTKVKELEDKNCQLDTQVKCLQADLSSSANQSSEVTELQESNSRLESQVQEYRDVLATTETKLQQLENSVEGEEKKWHEKLQALQLNLEQTKHENTSLKEELEKSKEASEMKEKVLNLEGKLQISEDKCSQLQGQVDESKEKIITLTQKVEQANQDDLLKQIEELKKLLETENKKSKDLATTNVRLNGIIKTGHDALVQEQELVKKLKSEVEEKSKGSGKSSSNEIDELKAKLEEKEKQLEKELVAKKQLSQRLAASQGNDLGTSV